MMVDIEGKKTAKRNTLVENEDIEFSMTKKEMVGFLSTLTSTHKAKSCMYLCIPNGFVRALDLKSSKKDIFIRARINGKAKRLIVDFP